MNVVSEPVGRVAARIGLVVASCMALVACGPSSQPTDASVSDIVAAADTAVAIDAFDTSLLDAVDLVAPDVTRIDVPAADCVRVGDAPSNNPPGARVPYHGGPVIPYVRLVTITFPGYAYRQQVEDLGAYMVASSWFCEAVGEFGCGHGEVLGNVVLSTPAPLRTTETDAEQFVGDRVLDGTLPRGPGGSFDGVVYVLYYPQSTTITGGLGMSCGYHGYHSEFDRDGLHFAYAIMPTCDQSYRNFSFIEGLSTGASHELAEAVTDPFDQTAPAWRGQSELTDLCVGNYVRRDGWLLARSWSNANAAAGLDPCVPLGP